MEYTRVKVGIVISIVWMNGKLAKVESIKYLGLKITVKEGIYTLSNK